MYPRGVCCDVAFYSGFTTRVLSSCCLVAVDVVKMKMHIYKTNISLQQPLIIHK